MALRDFLVKWRMDVDTSPLKHVDNQLNRLNKSVSNIATNFAGAFGLYKIGEALGQAVNNASDVDETMNVLSKTFMENTDQVLKWSQVMGKAMGRSQYQLQELASSFGAFLQPQEGMTTEMITEMSKQLGQLTIDLASFYNTTDEEARMRLFSGLSGETEAVRRLGIDISDTSLDAFNKKRGDNRRLATMTLAEKTQLRYLKILQDTTAKQGDAIDTYNSWENTWKRFKSEIYDASVEFGRELIPTLKKVVTTFEYLLHPLTSIGRESDMLTHELELLGLGIAGAASLYAVLNPMMALSVVGLAALAIAYDEARTMFGTDGPSDTLFGDFLENDLGIEDPAKKFQKIQQYWVGTLDVVTSFFYDIATIVPSLATAAWNSIVKGEKFNFSDRLMSSTTGAVKRLQNIGTLNEGVAVGNEINRPLLASGLQDAATIEAYKSQFKGQQMTTQQLRQQYNSDRRAGLQTRYEAGEMLVPTAYDVANGIATSTLRGIYAAPGSGHGDPNRSIIPAGPPVAGGGKTLEPVTINIYGVKSDEMAKEVEQALDARARRNAAALGRQVWTGAAY